MKVASLFTGVGGFDLGFEQAGHEVVYQCENDPKAQEILKKHWPDIHLETDVKNAKGNILRELGTQILTAGFPCQNVSVAGNREGLEGDKSRLFFEVLRIIKEARNIPYIVIENVPGLLSSNKGRDMETVIKGLEECGYQVEYRIFDSQNFGVPQRRRRVFIVGRPTTGRFGCGPQILFESEGLHRDSTQGEEVETPNSRDARKSTGDSGPRIVAPTLNASGAGTSRPGGQGAELGFYVVAFQPGNLTRKAGANPNSEVFPTLGAATLGDQAPHVAKGQVVGTLCNPPRRLTPIETERLQGFPDNFTEGVADTHRYRFMGNAVTVPVAKWIGEQIQRYEATNE
jgi:DNA (cytosine-5)-methyltransferase 1